MTCSAFDPSGTETSPPSEESPDSEESLDSEESEPDDPDSESSESLEPDSPASAFDSTDSDGVGSGSGSGASVAVTLETDAAPTTSRSEEHTSELQSRGQLVCRLLLEKKQTGHGDRRVP